MNDTKQCSKVLIMIAGLMILLSANAVAGPIRVIANPSVKTETISASELRSVFLEERSSLGDGSHVEPVLSKGSSAHEAFLKQFLNKDDDELQTYYRSLVFTGRGSMPKALHSDEEVVAYVSKIKGAIGYVGANASLDGVKTLVVVGSGENDGERKLITRIEPIYPSALQSNHIGGTVRLKVTVAANGSVESVEVMGGNPILGETAAAAVKKWIYAAGPSRSKTEVSIPFGENH